MVSLLKRLLAEPSTRGMELDDPRTTALRRQIVRTKPLLRRIYDQWYGFISTNIPAGSGEVLELGSGAGFLDEFIPQLITSEIFVTPGARVVLDGQRLPFPDAGLRAIAMTNVLHHLPDVRRFFAEATRCVRVGGTVAMVEPWVTQWSRLIYRKLHHERFDPHARRWGFDSDGPLSGANGALPWIVFRRDRQQFEREFPTWRIEHLRPILPFRYLLSGGVSLRALMPGWSSGLLRAAEAMMPASQTAMFAEIVLRRV